MPDPTPPLTEPAADLRASHADRERVAAHLHAAAGNGLFTLDEVDDRLAAAYAARHLSELAPLTADLPPATEGSVAVAPGWSAITAAVSLQLRTGVAASAQRRRAVRLVAAHPAVAAVVTALLLVGLVLLARWSGLDLA